MSDTTMVKERPILFSAPMVRALLDGTKTQTRRVISEQPVKREKYEPSNPRLDADGMWRWECGVVTYRDNEARCPYGTVGDRLWVRETLRGDGGENRDRRVGITRYSADSKMVLPHVCCGRVLCSCEEGSTVMDHLWEWTRPVLPAIHMPRWASRITLTVTDVRVQRVQDIDRADAKAEGFHSNTGSGLPGYNGQMYGNAELAFAACWDDLNAKRGLGWDVNPWVWAITFTVDGQRP